jgi:hypothetical protein
MTPKIIATTFSRFADHAPRATNHMAGLPGTIKGPREALPVAQQPVILPRRGENLTHNIDMFPQQAAIDAYPSAAPLIVNPIIDDAFIQHENAANRAKRIYHNVGRFAILLIALSAIFTLAEALLLPHTTVVRLASAIFAGLALFGIVLQLAVVFSRQKRRWLINRFAAERLRSIKFYGFAVADSASNLNELQRLADEFYRKALAQLANELHRGLTALDKFAPSAGVAAMRSLLPDSQSKPGNEKLSVEARQAYLELRVRYQQTFAAREAARLKTDKRMLEVSSDLLYLIGAAVVVAALAFRFMRWGTTELDFLAVVFFVAGLSVAILENASLNPVSQSRYERYAAEAGDVEREIASKRLEFGPMIETMETLALAELDDFCRAASLISYRL